MLRGKRPSFQNTVFLDDGARTLIFLQISNGKMDWKLQHERGTERIRKERKKSIGISKLSVRKCWSRVHDVLLNYPTHP